MKTAVIIVAGGKGLRMGSDLPKQFIPVKGKPILMHTIDVFHCWNPDTEIILVLPHDHQAYWGMLCRELDFKIQHKIVDGGETRFHSVKNGVSSVQDADLIAVHDGVRPLVHQQVIEACFVAAKENGAAIPVIPVVESIRVRDNETSKPVNRDHYCIVQTPQVFCKEWLIEGYQQDYDPIFTDDASVVEAMGKQIALISGNQENIKITTPIDLVVAKTLIGQ